MTHNVDYFRDLTNSEENQKMLLQESLTVLGRQFVRIVGAKNAIYIDPATPYWFVPSSKMDAVLGEIASDDGLSISLENTQDLNSAVEKLLSIKSLLSAIQAPEARPYSGRASRKLERLNEIWLHVTDKCNLACGHCLFSDRLKKPGHMNYRQVKDVVDQSIPLGLNVVCLTGGEPLTHPDFVRIITFLLSHDNIRIAVLTNGLLYNNISHALKDLDRSRVTFQVSVDGSESTHDHLRGHGAFARVVESISSILSDGFGCSLSMAVNEDTAIGMRDFIKTSSRLGVRNVHFMWHFRKGQGRFVPIASAHGLMDSLGEVLDLADELEIEIDNLEAIRSQIFTHIGTRFDLGSAGWDSLTIAPDGKIYPTPAMVGTINLGAGELSEGIENVWRNSVLLHRIRDLSLLDIAGASEDPLRFITGGGDIDHCILDNLDSENKIRIGDDPYRSVYNSLVVKVIEKEIDRLRSGTNPSLLVRMGDIIYDCHNDPNVNFTHSNCLLTLSSRKGGELVRNFYADRADQPDEVILNPIRPDDFVEDLIPEFALKRMYGCGSPISLAGVVRDQTVVDLGCGSGVEVFLAARTVGAEGKAVGVDMTPQMLDLAQSASLRVEKKLGFKNTYFLMGRLEEVPIRDNFADVVISNCVVNLTGNKRKVLSEIFRILKPGGRMVISDVVSDQEIPLEIKTDPRLNGECLGGALKQNYLFSMIKDAGFCSSSVLNRFPYRYIDGHTFFSLTFRATKPSSSETVPVIYKGPFEHVTLDQEGLELVTRGVLQKIKIEAAIGKDDLVSNGLMMVDIQNGAFIGQDDSQSCGCCSVESDKNKNQDLSLHLTDCLICGASLLYSQIPSIAQCSVCGNSEQTLCVCERGHYVCNNCHSANPLSVIEAFCIQSGETDLIKMLKQIRKNRVFPLNGPEHHSLAPAIILTSYRNLGGQVSDGDIREAIRRGKLIPGGSCASLGICGAAAGIGIAFSIISDASPLTPDERRTVMRVVSEAASSISSFAAERCCQRESYLSLKRASEMSNHLLGIHLPANDRLICLQHHRQKECIKTRCELYPAH